MVGWGCIKPVIDFFWLTMLCLTCDQDLEYASCHLLSCLGEPSIALRFGSVLMPPWGCYGRFCFWGGWLSLVMVMSECYHVWCSWFAYNWSLMSTPSLGQYNQHLPRGLEFLGYPDWTASSRKCSDSDRGIWTFWFWDWASYAIGCGKFTVPACILWNNSYMIVRWNVSICSKYPCWLPLHPSIL